MPDLDPTSNRVCYVCGSTGPRDPGSYTLRRRVAGHVITREVRALVCHECGERLISSATIESFEKQIGDELMAAGVRTSESLPWALGALGLDPGAVGATWMEITAWGRGATPVPEGVWEKVEAAWRERVQAQEAEPRKG